MQQKKTTEKHYKEHTFGDLLLLLIRGVFFFVMIAIFIGELFFRDQVAFIWESEHKLTILPQVLLWLCGIGLTGLLLCIYHRFRGSIQDFCQNYGSRIAAFGTLAFLLLALFISYQIYFYPGWDAGFLIDCAMHLADGTVSEIQGSLQGYFSSSPNNILLTLIFEKLIALGQKTGIFSDGHCLLVLIAFQCLLVSLCHWLIWCCIRKLSGSPVLSLLCWFGFGIFVCLSPWMVFPYSDTVAMIFPVLQLFLYLFWEDPRHRLGLTCIKWVLISFVAIIGYNIKPQTLLTFLALLVVALLRKYSTPVSIRRFVLIAVITLLSLMLTRQMITSVKDQFAQTQDFSMDNSLGILHFAMMGLNPDSNGMFSFEDVAYSRSFTTSEGQRQGDLTVIRQRLSDYGITGLLQHWAKKTIANYGDGTFGWGGNGGEGFYTTLYPEQDSIFSPWLRSLYYNFEPGFSVLFTFRQGIWLLILFFLPWAALGRRDRTSDGTLELLCLSVLALTLFECLFEAHARYLYHYTPFFLLLAAMGLQHFYHICISALPGTGTTGKK